MHPTTRDEAQTRFVEAWGRMGSVWGISRTMAEVHALLYISGESLCTDDVMERLEISRGNASMSLRALVDWGIIGREHRRGDRKEYFVADGDVWNIFRAIVRERRHVEVDALLGSLDEFRDGLGAGAGVGASGLPGRLDAMIAFLDLVAAVSERFAGPGGEGLELAATLLGSGPGKAGR
jgi:hypothetical protein